MRGKDYNAGLRGGLFEQQHYKRMGSSIWLYGWLVLRQTRENDAIGWVLGGAPVSYREIQKETGFNRRTLERWMRILRRHGYIETDVAPGGVIVRITKAKKFRKFSQFPQPVRKIAGPTPNAAGGVPQFRAANVRQSALFQEIARRMGSSFIERSKEVNAEIQNDLHSRSTQKNLELFPDDQQRPAKTLNSSCLGENQKSKRDQCGRFNATSGSKNELVPVDLSQREFWIEARKRLGLMRAEDSEEERRAGRNQKQ